MHSRNSNRLNLSLGNPSRSPSWSTKLFPCKSRVNHLVTMIHPLFRRVLAVPLLVLLLSSSSNQVLAKAGNPGTSISRSVVVSSESVTTTACNKIRFDKYRARLDLFYFYTVVFSIDAPVGAVVTGIENAIAHAVASSLDSCDDQERPMYAAKLSLAGHAVADGTGLCDEYEFLDDTNQCLIVRGTTSILLDSGAADAENKAYAAIERVLRDTFFLNQFTPADGQLQAAAFVRPIGENLIILTGPTSLSSIQDADTTQATGSSNGKALIAICTASVSFLCTSAFLYGLYRASKHNEERHRASPGKARIAHYQAGRRRYFRELHEQDHHLEPGWMVTDEASLQQLATVTAATLGHSITWSVSDLTSDAGSVHSTMSHAVSLPLERIVEEEAPYDEYDEECAMGVISDDGDMECPSSSEPPVRSVEHEHLDFIANWNHGFAVDMTMDVQEIGDEKRPGIEDIEKQPEDEDEDVAPVHKNKNLRVEDFDTPEDDTLQGCMFLDESIEDIGGDLTISNDSSPSSSPGHDSTSPSSGKKPSFTVTRYSMDMDDYLQLADLRDNNEAIDGIMLPPEQHVHVDQEQLDRWYEKTLLQLHRALHQKRILS